MIWQVFEKYIRVGKPDVLQGWIDTCEVHHGALIVLHVVKFARAAPAVRKSINLWSMNDHYKVFVESLKLLASSLKEQQQYLPDFADVPDDVTSTFESAYLLLPPLVESNRFSFEAIGSILRLYNKLQWCLRNIDLDDFSGFEWNKVRDMAKGTLTILGEPADKPDSNYI